MALPKAPQPSGETISTRRPPGAENTGVLDPPRPGGLRGPRVPPAAGPAPSRRGPSRSGRTARLPTAAQARAAPPATTRPSPKGFPEWTLGLWETPFGDDTYAHDSGTGDHVVIRFQGSNLVATLFDHDGHRSPCRREGEYDVERFFRGLPASRRPLAVFCVGYWHMCDRQGRDRPLVTTAFWDNGEYLTAADPWPDVWQHGGHLLRLQLLDNVDEALAGWQDDYGLEPDRIAFARSVFQRKMAQPDPPLVLESEDVAYLMAITGEGPEAYEEGTRKWLAKSFATLELHGNPFQEGCKVLESIGIQLPPAIRDYVLHDEEDNNPANGS